MPSLLQFVTTDIFTRLLLILQRQLTKESGPAPEEGGESVVASEDSDVDFLERGL